MINFIENRAFKVNNAKENYKYRAKRSIILVGKYAVKSSLKKALVGLPELTRKVPGSTILNIKLIKIKYDANELEETENFS